jgi:hypothetical protein
MATRSNIAVKLEDGSIKNVYCHSDGYLSWNGRILTEFYNSFEKAIELVDLGDLSLLNKNLKPTSEHSFGRPEQGVTIAYHRDRDESWEDVEPKTYMCQAEFENSVLRDCIIEYVYLFTDGEWKVAVHGFEGGFVPVTQLLTNKAS